jgi:hypothetical protein
MSAHKTVNSINHNCPNDLALTQSTQSIVGVNIYSKINFIGHAHRGVTRRVCTKTSQIP